MGHLLQCLAHPFEFFGPLALLQLGVALLLNHRFVHFRRPIAHCFEFPLQSGAFLFPELALLLKFLDLPIPSPDDIRHRLQSGEHPRKEISVLVVNRANRSECVARFAEMFKLNG